MNWSKTKTIFIICFLLLDIFLGYQLYDRQREAQVQLEGTPGDAFTRYIQNGKIQIQKGELPNTDQKVYFLSGTPTNFGKGKSKSVAATLKKLSGPKDKPVLLFSADPSGTVLHGEFVTPMEAPDNTTDQQAFLEKYVYNGDEYKYWSYDKKKGIMQFIQLHDSDTVFSIDNDQLNTLNLIIKDGKVTGYDQTYIKIATKEKVAMSVKPMDAIHKLWDQNKLPVIKNPKVESVELGYINMTSDTTDNQEQIFNPAWYIKVKTSDGESEYFVTVIYGKIYQAPSGEK